MLRALAAELVDVDADGYAEVLAMRDVAGMLPAEERDREVGRAFAAAAEPPLAIARLAAEVAELADIVAARGDEHVHVDAAVAGVVAAAAARGGLALVATNLTARADDPRVEEAARLAESAEQAASHALARSS
jgi:formiminotetrahydrofolate cyclodeaminase